MIELREMIAHYYGRLLCRLFRYHGWTCQGRTDHVRGGRVIR